MFVRILHVEQTFEYCTHTHEKHIQTRGNIINKHITTISIINHK